MAYDIVTTAYRTKMAMATAGAALPAIATIMVGTGGVDVNGNPIEPSASNTGLYSQVLSKAVGVATYPTATSVQYSITVNPADLPANTKISEVGLKDSVGTFVAHSTFTAKPTDGETTMTFNIELQL